MPIIVKLTFHCGRTLVVKDNNGHTTFRSFATDICSKPWMLWENLMIHTDDISIIEEVTE